VISNDSYTEVHGKTVKLITFIKLKFLQIYHHGYNIRWEVFKGKNLLSLIYISKILKLWRSILAGCCVTSDTMVNRDKNYTGTASKERASLVLRIAPTFLR